MDFWKFPSLVCGRQSCGGVKRSNCLLRALGLCVGLLESGKRRLGTGMVPGYNPRVRRGLLSFYSSCLSQTKAGGRINRYGQVWSVRFGAASVFLSQRSEVFT